MLLSFLSKNEFINTRIVQLVRTLISCIKNENSIFSPGLYTSIQTHKNIFISIYIFLCLSLNVIKLDLDHKVHNGNIKKIIFKDRFDPYKNNNNIFTNLYINI